MDALRIALLIIGILLVAAIYWWGTRARRRKQDAWFAADEPEFGEEPPTRGHSRGNTGLEEPWDTLGEEDLEGVGKVVVRREEPALESLDLGPVAADAEAPPEEEDEDEDELIVALTVMAHGGRQLAGAAVLEALEAAGLQHGLMDIYHLRPAGHAEGRPICSVANVVEPGVLDPDDMDTLETPGLLLFMRLPGPVDGREAFEKTLQTGRTLAERLGAELCDERRSVLTVQSISLIKERIEAWRLKRQMERLRRSGQGHRRGPRA